jgi:hypothetical protein
MRTLILFAGFVLTLSGCASTAPQMVWGKPGVSKVDYATDVGSCTGLAVTQSSGNGANTAGGVDGKVIADNKAASPTAPPTSISGEQTSHVSAPLPAGGAYSGMASGDYASRAATQQRAQEMAAQRARSEALKSCLVGRGYREFALTAEQRAHLATLTRGTHEYLEYLHSIGSSPDVVAGQSAPAK